MEYYLRTRFMRNCVAAFVNVVYGRAVRSRGLILQMYIPHKRGFFSFPFYIFLFYFPLPSHLIACLISSGVHTFPFYLFLFLFLIQRSKEGKKKKGFWRLSPWNGKKKRNKVGYTKQLQQVFSHVSLIFFFFWFLKQRSNLSCHIFIYFMYKKRTCRIPRLPPPPPSGKKIRILRAPNQKVCMKKKKKREKGKKRLPRRQAEY